MEWRACDAQAAEEALPRLHVGPCWSNTGSGQGDFVTVVVAIDYDEALALAVKGHSATHEDRQPRQQLCSLHAL